MTKPLPITPSTYLHLFSLPFQKIAAREAASRVVMQSFALPHKSVKKNILVAQAQFESKSLSFSLGPPLFLGCPYIIVIVIHDILSQIVTLAMWRYSLTFCSKNGRISQRCANLARNQLILFVPKWRPPGDRATWPSSVKRRLRSGC